MCEFDKPDKTFASDLYLIYKPEPKASVCIYISDKDRLLMFYLSHKNKTIQLNVVTNFGHGTSSVRNCDS